MSKANKSNRKSSKRSPKVHVPVGLSTAFRLISVEGEATHSAQHYSEEAYPHASRIIDELFGRTDGEVDNDTALEEELKAATRRMYSLEVEDTAESVSCVSQASFRVGFAVCWLLIAQVNGAVTK